MDTGFDTLGLSGLAFFFSKDLIKARGMTKLLFWQAKHDTLTKLPNRISFEERAQSLIFDASKHESTHAMFHLHTHCDIKNTRIINITLFE